MTPAPRLPVLDGLRGVAILLVLVLHFTMYGGTPGVAGIDGFVHRFALAGWIGVDLFFVLSGFLITGILWDAKGGERYFRNFYARRLLRIFPLYYGALVVFLVLLPLLWPAHAGLARLRGEGVWYWTYLVNFQIAREGWPDFGALGHFWSLAVEEQFYLLWPVAVFLLRRRPLMALCAGAGGMAVGVRLALHLADREPAAFVLLPARVDALAAGALLALAVRGPGGLPAALRWAKPAAVASLAGLAAIFIWKRGLPAEDPAVAVAGYSLLAVLFAGVLTLALAAAPEGRAGRWLAAPGLAFFGRYSYGLYVLHHPLLFLKPEWLSYGSLPEWLLFVAAGTGVTVVLALLSWNLWEKPFLDLKDRFPYASAPREDRGTPPAAAPALRPASRGR
ncbi:acyltransferase [bacterium]|nr:MAG: acyltransferase [bacterium]